MLSASLGEQQEDGGGKGEKGEDGEGEREGKS